MSRFVRTCSFTFILRHQSKLVNQPIWCYSGPVANVQYSTCAKLKPLKSFGVVPEFQSFENQVLFPACFSFTYPSILSVSLQQNSAMPAISCGKNTNIAVNVRKTISTVDSALINYPTFPNSSSTSNRTSTYCCTHYFRTHPYSFVRRPSSSLSQTSLKWNNFDKEDVVSHGNNHSSTGQQIYIDGSPSTVDLQISCPSGCAYCCRSVYSSPKCCNYTSDLVRCSLDNRSVSYEDVLSTDLGCSTAESIVGHNISRANAPPAVRDDQVSGKDTLVVLKPVDIQISLNCPSITNYSPVPSNLTTYSFLKENMMTQPELFALKQQNFKSVYPTQIDLNLGNNLTIDNSSHFTVHAATTPTTTLSSYVATSDPAAVSTVITASMSFPITPVFISTNHGTQVRSTTYPLVSTSSRLSFASVQPNGVQFTISPLAPTGYFVSSSLYMEALSMTIWQFYATTRQSTMKYAKKVHLRNALHMVVSGVFENAGLFIVGSSMNGFGSDQSDMDMCLTITSRDLQQKKEAFLILSQLLPPLRKCSFIKNLHLIRAKVPILKFRDTLAGVDCDLNVNNVVGIYNTHLLAMYTRIDWRVRPLGMFVKYWAQRMDIHDGSRGRLSTYPLLLMLIQYLQSFCSPPILPNLQAKFPKIFNYARPLSELDMRLELPWAELRSNNPASLAELFVGFIHYYSNEFDFNRWAVSVRHGSPLPVDVAIRRLPPHEQAHTARSFKVFVEEPFCQANAARSLYDDNILARIRQAFIKTNQALRSQRPLESIWIHTPFVELN